MNLGCAGGVKKKVQMHAHTHRREGLRGKADGWTGREGIKEGTEERHDTTKHTTPLKVALLERTKQTTQLHRPPAHGHGH